MIARSLNIPEIKFITFKNKPINSNKNTPRALPTVFTRFLSERNNIIDWLYRAQHTLKVSRSTLFLGVALLDRLVTQGMPLSHQTSDLVGGTILLIVTKFNEVYPVTIRKLNALSTDVYSTQKYIETEANILEKVSYDLTPKDPIYEELAELQDKLGQKSQQSIKLAVQNPSIAFKMGSAVLLSALESISSGIMERKNQNRLSRESADLRMELQRLGSLSPSLKRMVSPSRA